MNTRRAITSWHLQLMSLTLARCSSHDSHICYCVKQIYTKSTYILCINSFLSGCCTMPTMEIPRCEQRSQPSLPESTPQTRPHFGELSPAERGKAIDDFWDKLMDIRDILDDLTRSHPTQTIVEAKAMFDNFVKRMASSRLSLTLAHCLQCFYDSETLASSPSTSQRTKSSMTSVYLSSTERLNS